MPDRSPTFLADLWRSLMRPSSPCQTPEEALVRGLAHIAPGAALALVLPVWAAVAIYALKEANDIRQRGLLTDGLFDLGFVALGALQPVIWPVLGILGGLFQGWLIWRRQHV